MHRSARLAAPFTHEIFGAFARVAIGASIIVLAVAMAWAGETFQPLESLAKPLRERLKPADAASFHLRLDAGVDCTGTYISSSGHFVTALHCVAGCLAKSRALVKEAAVDEPTSQPKRGPAVYTYKMTVDDDRVDEGVNCPGWIGDRHHDIEVIMTGGKGWLAPKESVAAFSRRFPDEYKGLLDEGYEHDGDFAVLRAVGVTSSACLPLAESGPREGQPLQAVSYACLSRDELSTTGLTPLYTEGRRSPGFKASQLFKSRKGVLDFDPKLIDRRETFFSTLDMEKCGSGTALLSQDLSVVGIATRVYKSSTAYESGSLEAISAGRIRQILMERKSGADIKAITACGPSTRRPAGAPAPAAEPLESHRDRAQARVRPRPFG